MKIIPVLAAAALVMAACTEPSQDMRPNAAKSVSEYDGTGTHFVAQGWTQGDKASWLQALKVRTQRGQNEYLKVQ